MLFCAGFLVLLTLVRFSTAGESDIQQVKNRRGGGTLGLFAFPRVGRSDPSLMASSSWDSNVIPLSSYEEYEEIPRTNEMKRANLMAFPRVGRQDNQFRKWAKLAAMQQDMEKRTGISATSGLWFGPRLGRIQKRSPSSADQKDSKVVFTPRLGRESEELLDNSTDDYNYLLKNLYNFQPNRQLQNNHYLHNNHNNMN